MQQSSPGGHASDYPLYRLDWTGQDSNWGVGLPPEPKNKEVYPLLLPLLANPDLRPTQASSSSSSSRALCSCPRPLLLFPSRHLPKHCFQAMVLVARSFLLELLRVRRSSQLFRLPTTLDVLQHLKLQNQGPSQVPGVLFFQLVSASPGRPSSLSTMPVYPETPSSSPSAAAGTPRRAGRSSDETRSIRIFYL